MLFFKPALWKSRRKSGNMPSSTSTLTTSKARPENTAPRLRALDQDTQSKSSPAKEGNDYDIFFWTYTEEPHRTRRQAIIKAHPEVGACPRSHWKQLTLSLQVTKLCGPEPLTKYFVTAVVLLQVLCAYLLRNTPFLSWQFFLTAYIIGATANQNLFLAIHEISHNLAFRSPLANRLLAIFANLPIGIPYSASFRVSKIPPPDPRP